MDFGVQQSEANINLAPTLFNQLFWPLVIFFIVVFVIFIILLIVRKILSSQKIFYPSYFEKKVFMLSIPKKSLDRDNDRKEISDLIAGVENFYANLGGMKAPKGLKTWLFGRHDNWSLEIVVGDDKLITFYVAIPQYLAHYVQQQLLSQYPDCQVEEVDDYNIFKPQGFAAIGYLKLVKSIMFPILTYKNIETDPLVSILSVLSKLPEGQTAAIQLVMRSARKEWRNQGVKVASEMHQGKSLQQAMKSTGSGGLLSALGKPSDWFYQGGDNQSPAQSLEAHRLSPMEEQVAKSIEEKASKAGLDVNIRIVAFASLENSARDTLRQISNAFSQYSNYEYANGFKAVLKGSFGKKLINDYIYRDYDDKIGIVLNTEELVSLWHLPLPNTETPHIRWLSARKLPPPVNMPQEGLVLGENFYRGEKIQVRIKDKDRQRHMYIIGMTGTGKSWLMANLAIQDIENGRGVCVIDPHGSLIDDILPHIPKERQDDVIIFDPADIKRPVGLNMLEATTPQEMDFAAQEMINIFYKLLPDPSMAGPMFEHYMRNALLALMADVNNPGTLVELARIFTDAGFRREKLKYVQDVLVRDFWEREYPASQKGSTGADMLSYVISKTGRFVENEMMRNIIGQSRSGVNFRQVMDEGKILLMNLSKGRMGETNSSLLGLIAVSKLQMAALARADMSEEQRKDFYLYIDEFQNFITDSISTILAEARKYKLNLIMGHQYIAQLIQNNDTRVKDAVFGNVGTIVSFRIGVDDSEIIAKQLAPQVSEHDVMNIDKFNAYTRILIDNTASDTFNMHCFHLPDDGNKNSKVDLKKYSREKYGRDRDQVVKNILERSKIGQLGQKPESDLKGLTP